MDNLDFLGDEEPAEGMPAAETSAEYDYPQGLVPMQAMFDERAKRQAWEQHAAELQAQLDASGYDEAPEPFEDGGEGRLADLVQRQESLMLDASERMAAMAHGPDVTESAKQWALNQPPEFRQLVRNQHDPYDYLVRLYRVTQDDVPDPYHSHSNYWRPQAPPRSQATTPSAMSGGRAYLSDEDAFDGAFTKRK